MNLILKTFIMTTVLSFTLVAGAAFAQAPPVVGTIGVPIEETKILTKGWSIKNDIMDKDVFNDANEKVGVIEDIIVRPEKATSYAIVSTGGFLGIAKYDVAIPVNQFQVKNKQVILPGATKEAVKAMPEFIYAE